jgi:hypothetical protein
LGTPEAKTLASNAALEQLLVNGKSCTADWASDRERHDISRA